MAPCRPARMALALGFLVFRGAGLVSALTTTSISNGLWTAETTWDNGVPDSTKDVVISNSTVTINDALLHVMQSLTIQSNASLTHATNTISTAETAKVVLDITGTLTIEAGGQINVLGKGYPAGKGPGGGGWTKNDGGSYGGQGGVYSDTNSVITGGVTNIFVNLVRNATYGSCLAPTNLGSGGGGTGRGGGAILLNVAGAATHNGTITANGADASGDGAGSGGSVYLRTGSLSGSGSITADGGNCGRGLGGGGRVAVILTGAGSDWQGYTGAMHAYAGAWTPIPSAYRQAAAGTVYMETPAQGSGKGRLAIDNSNRTILAWIATQLPPATNATAGELDRVALTLTNSATRVTLTTNLQVRDLVIGTNAFMTLTNFNLSVAQFEHSLEDPTQARRGATNRVDHYAQIIWRRPATVIALH